MNEQEISEKMVQYNSIEDIDIDGRMSAFDMREEQFLVGRKGQLERFDRFLTGEGDAGQSIWNIYGTAGVGKSFLLDSFRRSKRAGSSELAISRTGKMSA